MTTDPRIERLAQASAITTHMLQLGCSKGLLDQQLTILRSATHEVLEAQDIGFDTHLHIPTPISESVAEQLAEDVVVPDDASGAED